ncbi:hypothetical protein AR437_07500 [Christensenella hongkongensis]|uniref:hypothetical protein n=1 Tax=Christensenella hongkongensis TaxID=270498 RepID=UPI0007402BB3|nr:hypothetical protein [Christensenella hongkongensis]KUJ30163.1 hypothetical protein AR437_07500 [Christensenella hongkongensis]
MGADIMSFYIITHFCYQRHKSDVGIIVLRYAEASDILLIQAFYIVTKRSTHTFTVIREIVHFAAELSERIIPSI